MAFILSKDRGGLDCDVSQVFKLYQAYLESVRDKLPHSAYSLATSAWYYVPIEHLQGPDLLEERRTPHDGWLEHVHITESVESKRKDSRSVQITIKLLEAHHDGYIEFRYKDVKNYAISMAKASPTTDAPWHEDWRYDEFRLSDNGLIIHEIEWSSGPLWKIECADLQYSWLPFRTTPEP